MKLRIKSMIWNIRKQKNNPSEQEEKRTVGYFKDECEFTEVKRLAKEHIAKARI